MRTSHVYGLVILLITHLHLHSQSFKPVITNTNGKFRISGLQKPNPYPYDEVDKKKTPEWVYWWEFGDGHYSTEVSPTHQYATPGHRARLYLMPKYSRDLPQVVMQEEAINTGSQAIATNRSYQHIWNKADDARVFIYSNADGMMVPNYRSRFAIHYRKLATNGATSGYLMLFFNEKNLSAFPGLFKLLLESDFSGEGERITEPDINDFDLQTEFRRLSARYQNAFAYRVSMDEGEQRLFFTLQSNPDLKRYLAEKVEAKLTAIFVPDKAKYTPKIHKAEYELTLNEVRDPNRFKVRPKRPYFRKQFAEPLSFKVDFENVGSGRVRNVSVLLDWPVGLDASSIKIVERYPDSLRCEKCPEGYVAKEEDRDPCFEVDTSMLQDGKVNLNFYNLFLLGKKGEEVRKKAESKGFVRFEAYPAAKRGPSLIKASIGFEGADTLKAGKRQIPWKQRHLALQAGYMQGNGYHAGLVLQDVNLRRGLGWGLGLQYNRVKANTTQLVDFSRSRVSPEGGRISIDQDLDMHSLELEGYGVYRFKGILGIKAGGGISLPLDGSSLFSAELFRTEDGELSSTPYLQDLSSLDFGLLRSGEEAIFVFDKEVEAYGNFGLHGGVSLEIGPPDKFILGLKQNYRWHPSFFGDGCKFLVTYQAYLQVPLVNLSPKHFSRKF